MPRDLIDAVELEGRQAWLATVPAVVGELGDLWSLEIGEGCQPGGQTAWVAPARDSSDTPLVLEVGWEHSEAVHEADALAVWDGRVQCGCTRRSISTARLRLGALCGVSGDGLGGSGWPGRRVEHLVPEDDPVLGPC
jgi:hypothetical protein